MDDIGHSPLLKFIVPERKIPNMSEPNFKIKLSFDNSNIISTVPGDQKLRISTTESNFTNVIREYTIEDSTDIVDDSTQIKAKHHTELKNHEEKLTGNEINETADAVAEASKDDFVLTPVMTVTKEEAVFTKGDLKLQKVTVTEDISGTEMAPVVGKEKVSLISNDEPEIRTEVRREQIRMEIQPSENEQKEGRKPKTRIPTLKFRQAVDQLKEDRKNFEDKREPEAPRQKPRRSSIPRLKDGKSSAPIIKDSTPSKIETTDSLPQISDEFDKLYNEIAEDQDSLDNLPIISKIEDPVKLENTFEEIIHAYEDNKIQPVNIEKVRQSKIPLLKRKSEHEIEVPKQTSLEMKHSVIVDLSKTKIPGNNTETHSKIQSATLNKSPIRTGLISKKITEIKAIHDSSMGHPDHFDGVNVATIEEINNNNECNIMNIEVSNEILHKTPRTNDDKEEITVTEKYETDEVAASDLEPTYESIQLKRKDNINELIVPEVKSFKKNEDKRILTQSQEKNNPVSSTKSSVEKNTNMNIEEETSTEGLPENQNEEDIPILRGKVNRIIKRIDSRETEVKQSKIDFGDETPKQKSVLSKIAMFEHSVPDDVTPKLKDIAQTSHNKPSDTIEFKHDLINHKPIIVEEVLKALPAKVIEANIDNDNDNYSNICKSKTSDTMSTIKYDPKNNVDIVNTEVINTHPNSQSVEHKEITEVNNDEVINPQINICPEMPIDNGHVFDIKIVNIQPKASVQPTKTKESKFPLDLEFDDLENNYVNPTNVEKNAIKLSQVASKSISPTVVHNNQWHTDNSQNPISNINNQRQDNLDIDSKTAFAETEVHQKAEQNFFEDKQNNIKCKEDSNLNEPVISNCGSKIISDIVKQEVKFKPMKVNEHIKVKENRKKARKDEGQLRIQAYRNNDYDKKINSSTLADLDLGDAVHGRVKNMIVRMKSLDRLDPVKKEVIDLKERPRRKSVSEKIALFERKLSSTKLNRDDRLKIQTREVPEKSALSEEEYAKKIEELSLAKAKYGVLDPEKMKYLQLRDGGKMPAVGIGTALLDRKLTRYVVQAAIDLGYRTIDTAYIYGNEKEVGEAINDKIKDGTVSRSELFVISKLWSTFHRQDLVQRACRASLDAMGLDYFDLYLIHNPMSFKEGGDPVPKIANVLQFSEHDYLDAWFGVETLVREGLVKRGGVSNFNSQQIDKVVDKGKIKPAINQVECHPYLSQHRLDDFCQARNVKLCCFGVLGSKGTPQEHKSALPPAIDDPLVRVMAAGLTVSPATLLISYQLALDRGVIVKASSAAHLWDNLHALTFNPTPADVSALHALNRNKRTFTFKGMGDTHRNYPFNIPY